MSPHPSTVMSGLAESLAVDPGRPVVTFYDGATGERIELSLKTFDNWVSKIANFFTDELGLEPGEVVRVDLPSHWQSTVTLVAAWTAGLQVAMSGSTVNVAASVVGPAALAHPAAVAGQPILCSLRPLGGPALEPLPSGWLDFAREVPSQPDVLLAPALVGASDVALDVMTGALTHKALVEQGHNTADELGIHVGGRLITDVNPARPSGLAAGLLVPLVTDSSVVLVTNSDAAARSRITEQERATASFWLSG